MIVVSGTITSDFPIIPEQLAKMKDLSSNLGLASILTFSEHMNHTVEIKVFYACPETIHTDWFKEFVHKLATVFYLGRKYDLGLTGPIEISDLFYEHLGGELYVESGVTTFQQGRMEYGVFELAGHCKVINPLPRPELA